jgi:hypothetical protein
MKKHRAITFVLLSLFCFLVHAQSGVAAVPEKRDICVLVQSDPAFPESFSAETIERSVLKSAVSNTLYNMVIIPQDKNAQKQRIKDLLRKGEYETAVRLLKDTVPNDKVLILSISLIKDLEDQRSAYLSYLFYDSAVGEKYFNFIEKPFALEQKTVLSVISGIMSRPPENLLTRVDISKPISVCFLIDNSGSMQWNDNDFNPNDQFFYPRQTARANAIRLILNKLAVNDEFAFVFFSEKIDSIQDSFIRIRNRQQIESLASKVVEKLGFNPGTDIGEAFRRAAEILKTAATSNTYIIFLTDGSPTQGEKNFNRLRGYAKLYFRNSPVFAIGLEGLRQDKGGYSLEKGFLKDLAYDSDGMFYIVKIRPGGQDNRYSEINMVVDNIFNSIRREQTVVNAEAKTRTVENDRVVYSWDFTITSDCPEFSILVEPWEDNYLIEVIDPTGAQLPKTSMEIVKLARSASCRIFMPNCKGDWKLNVKVPR